MVFELSINEDDFRFQNAFKDWAECIGSHGKCMIRETERFVEILACIKVSDKTKNEIASTIGDLQADIDLITKTIDKIIK